MNTPPMLLAAALVFWGWQTDLLFPGLVAAGLLESSRWMPLRWDFTFKELKRIWDLCVLLTLGAAVYCYFSEDMTNWALVFFQWFPLLMFPMMLAQAFGHQDRMPISTFSLFFRRQREPESDGVNISHAYFGVCLLAASAANNRSPGFYYGLCALLAWGLWNCRARRFSPATWTGLLSLIVIAGYYGAFGLNRLQVRVESKVSEWISSFINQETDPTENRTAIGQIGHIKLSGRIAWRVEAAGQPPDLLRMASYDFYKNGSWFVTDREFGSLNPYGDPAAQTEGNFRLLPAKAARRTATISGYLPKGHGIIPLPLGTAMIESLQATSIETNRMGSVIADQAPDLARYTARFDAGDSIDAPPTYTDYEVPPREQDAAAAVVKELDLTGKPTTEKARRIAAFFQDRFTYSTYLRGQQSDEDGELSPVSYFLLKSRTGHCEYFGTATVLVLRAAGVPARYATGYSVQEAAGQNRFVVRERHAHAWTIYYDEGKKEWRDFDTTPGGWVPIEDARASVWEPVADFFSRLWYEFSLWRWHADRAAMQRYLIWLLIPLAGILTWRLITARRRARGTPEASEAGASIERQGLDSEFYLVEQHLAGAGLNREPGENCTAWLTRVESAQAVPPSTLSLHTLLDLHYRYRFDPHGLAEEEREQLRAEATGCLDRMKTVEAQKRQ